LYEPYELTPIAERTFAAAGVDPVERDRWLQAGFGHHAALNYIRAGASLEDAIAARSVGLDSRTLASAVLAGHSVDELVTEFVEVLGADPERLARLTTAGISLALVRSARGHGIPLDVIAAVPVAQLERTVALMDVGYDFGAAGRWASGPIPAMDIADAVRRGAALDEAAWLAVVPRDGERRAWQAVTADPIDALTRRKHHQLPIDAFDGLDPEVRPLWARRPILLIGDDEPRLTRRDGSSVPAVLLSMEAGSDDMLDLAYGIGFEVRFDRAFDRLTDGLSHCILIGVPGQDDDEVVGRVDLGEQITLEIRTPTALLHRSDRPTLAGAFEDLAGFVERSERETEQACELRLSTYGIDRNEVLIALSKGARTMADAEITIDGQRLTVMSDDDGDRWWVPLEPGRWPCSERLLDGWAHRVGRMHVVRAAAGREAFVIDSPQIDLDAVRRRIVDGAPWASVQRSYCGEPAGPLWTIEYEGDSAWVVVEHGRPGRTETAEPFGVLATLGAFEVDVHDEGEQVEIWFAIADSIGPSVPQLARALAEAGLTALTLTVLINDQPFVVVEHSGSQYLLEAHGEYGCVDVTRLLPSAIGILTRFEGASRVSGTYTSVVGELAPGVYAVAVDNDGDRSVVALEDIESAAGAVCQWVELEHRNEVIIALAAEALFGDGEHETIAGALVSGESETEELAVWIDVDEDARDEIIAAFQHRGWGDRILALTDPSSPAARERDALRRIHGVDGASDRYEVGDFDDQVDDLDDAD
jgi:hypothetical protein